MAVKCGPIFHMHFFSNIAIRREREYHVISCHFGSHPVGSSKLNPRRVVFFFFFRINSFMQFYVESTCKVPSYVILIIFPRDKVLVSCVGLLHRLWASKRPTQVTWYVFSGGNLLDLPEKYAFAFSWFFMRQIVNLVGCKYFLVKKTDLFCWAGCCDFFFDFLFPYCSG